MRRVPALYDGAARSFRDPYAVRSGDGGADAAPIREGKHMAKRSLVALALVATLLLTVGPVSAIVYGELDNGRHPYVGAFVVERDGEFVSVCSGTLISETVFLTAAHCVREERVVYVSFDDEITQTSTFHPGKAFAHPKFGSGGANNTYDIAVIVLDEPVAMDEYGRLPSAGLLDELKSQLRSQPFTAVGYGAIRESRKKGFEGILDNDHRRMALQSFNSLTKSWLKLSMNQATGDGGTCYGDSGGPHFLGGEDSNLVVSLTVTGDTVCKATDVTYRVDTESARDFLADFVDLP